MMMIQGQSTSGSISPIREFLFFFGESGGFWSKKLRGFSHLLLAEFISDDILIKFEPLFNQGHLEFLSFPFENKENFTIVYVKTHPNNKNRLVRPALQTCSTLIQYVAGIDLGAITPNGLFKALTESDKDWLKARGVLEVSKWEK